MDELLSLLPENALEASVIVAFITTIGLWLKSKMDLRLAQTRITSEERLKYYSDLFTEVERLKLEVEKCQHEHSIERFEAEKLRIVLYRVYADLKDLKGVCNRHGIEFTRRSDDDDYIQRVLGLSPTPPNE